MRQTIRTLLTSFLIAAVAPMGLAALDLEQPAYAKNGNGGGNGGGKVGGNGGGNGGGQAGEHGNKGGSASAKGQAKAAKTGTEDGEGEGLKPNQLGKLNGVLHASPNAIAHASENSPIGTAREFGEALAGFLGLGDEDTTEGEGDEVADDGTDEPTIDELGEMMANMTNKPVTADQVQAVADKVGIETTDEAPTDEAPTDEASTDEASTDETTDEQASEEPSEGEESPALDQATAQEIADEANEIHGFDNGDETSGDDTGSGDTADAGDTSDDTGDTTGDAGEETVTN